MNNDPLFSVRQLEKHYTVTDGLLNTEVGRVKAVDGISFELEAGETFGIVGESGCGKSSAARAMLRLTDPTGGKVSFRGEDIIAWDDERLKRFRRDAQMVFQDPDSSFDPRMSVGDAIAEPLIVQGLTDSDQRRDIVADLLERVGLAPKDAERYPHEFSGGQKQRIALARALSVNPDMIIADEPVSALDVSVQAEILALLSELQQELDLTLVIISHDLDVVRTICDRVAVMYLGEFVEVGPVQRLFTDPQHPYTQALLSAIPSPDPANSGLEVRITGEVPDPADPPSGCRFRTRCPVVIQPSSIDLEQSVWRSLLSFRRRLFDDSFTPDDIASRAALNSAELDSETVNAITDVPQQNVDALLRQDHNLPSPIEDDSAENAFTGAVAGIAAGDVPRARESLTPPIVTPCEREVPRLEQQAPGHRAACLLLDQNREM